MTQTALSFEKLRLRIPTLSYEFFPPKSPEGWGTLYSSLGEVAMQQLDFVSMTYGAGGSTREKTVDLVGRIQNELNIESMAHLTCGGHSRDELRQILDQLQAVNVQAVMAVRGDPPRGQRTFSAHPQGFSHASELIDFIRQHYDFTIACACYPEIHPESSNAEDDINYLKLKQDCGADFTVTQLFFDNDDFYRFRQRAEAAGITIPIVAGIMPVNSTRQLTRFQDMCGCHIPRKLGTFLGRDTDSSQIVQRGIEYAVLQCVDLLEHEVAGIHLYTLNKSISSRGIMDALRFKGYFAIH